MSPNWISLHPFKISFPGCRTTFFFLLGKQNMGMGMVCGPPFISSIKCMKTEKGPALPYAVPITYFTSILQHTLNPLMHSLQPT